MPVVTTFYFFLHLHLAWYEGMYFRNEPFISVTKWWYSDIRFKEYKKESSSLHFISTI